MRFHVAVSALVLAGLSLSAVATPITVSRTYDIDGTLPGWSGQDGSFTRSIPGNSNIQANPYFDLLGHTISASVNADGGATISGATTGTPGRLTDELAATIRLGLNGSTVDTLATGGRFVCPVVTCSGTLSGSNFLGTLSGSASGSGMPGVVQLSVDNTILADHPGTIVTGEVTMSGTARVDYTLDKNQRFVDFHLDRANQARPFAASGYVYSCFTSVGKCIATLSKLATSDGTSRALTVLGLIAAIATVATVGGIAAVIGASIGVVTAFAGYMVATHEKLAADPPDLNYAEVATYSGEVAVVNTGLSAELDAYLGTMITTMIQARDAIDAKLTSLERFQGALIDGDDEAAQRQLAALTQFDLDLIRFENQTGDLVAGLPDLFESLGVPDLAYDPAGLLAVQAEAATEADAQLRATILGLDPAAVPAGTSAFDYLRDAGLALRSEPQAVPEPAPWALIALAISLGALRRFLGRGSSSGV
jgi:hypothetical protein